ncbi:MmcQ/YjbR family DNA-binding protein [Nocardioides pocheonensis]|uniref:MmcQ/YjbR family DNA-binding protein n=2 Tax=Nocardioides pocheonensis TaxID=661485 RepID=A0A3N0GIH1_9ACTN|nr:MmcQ/YjbR family DNA-binding protein [Nocardioides pocheonensis]
MTGADLHWFAWSVALDLPGVAQSRPFGPDYEVFKVGGKVFVMTTVVRGTPIVTLKCEPEHAVALRQQFGTITAGYHMNKRHWTSVAAGAGVSRGLVEELVRNAYLLVVDRLPRAKRPDLPSARNLHESSPTSS